MSNEPNDNGIIPNDNNAYEANGNQEQFEDVYSNSNMESSPIQNSVQENVSDLPTEPVEYQAAAGIDNMQNVSEPQIQQPVDNAYQPQEQYAAPQNDGQQYNEMPQSNMAPVEYYQQDNNGYYAYDPQNQQGYYGYNYQNQYSYQPIYEVKKVRPPRYGVAVTSMILGISSLLLFGMCCCYASPATIVTSLVGIILAFVSFSGGNKGGFAISGLITNIIAFLLSVAMIIIFIVAFSSTGSVDYLYEFYPYM